MGMCLMNILKVGTSGLVSFLCSKHFDGSCYCSSLATVSIESAPFLTTRFSSPIQPSIPSTLALLFLEHISHVPLFPLPKTFPPGCLDILMVQPLNSFHLCSNVSQQSPLGPCTLKSHAPSWAILITLSAMLLFLALSTFIMLYCFIFLFGSLSTSTPEWGKLPWMGNRMWPWKKLNKFYFMNTGGQGRNQAWFPGLRSKQLGYVF